MIIDANSLASRGFYVNPYTFFNMVLDLGETGLYFAFDHPNLTRRIYYPEYKATRKPSPDRKDYVNRVKQALMKANCNVLQIEGYEADDILGSCGQEVLSGDRDLLQLVGKKKVWLIGRTFQDRRVWTPQEVRDKFGVWPEQLADYKALVGEASDNIPGVYLVGPKTAAKLLQDWGDLDAVYANLDKIKIGARLVAGRERAYLSRDLATILTDPIALPADKGGSVRDAVAIFRSML